MMIPSEVSIMRCRCCRAPPVTWVAFLLFILCLPSIATADLNSDKQALLTFAALLPHGRKLNWTSNSSLCDTWVGVTCASNNGGVRTLRLPAVGLFGPLPDVLGKLDSLEVLSLRSNRLAADLPANVSSLPSLRSLYLQHNNLSGFIPASLASSLRFLDLSYNSFGGGIPAAIGNLTQLTTLYLENNLLSGAIPDLRLPNLRHLNLSHNNLSGPIPRSLAKFSVDAFAGNINLCGPPLDPCPGPLAPTLSLSPSPIPLPDGATRHKSFWKRLGLGTIIGIAAGIAVLLLILVVVLLICILRRKGAAADGQGGAEPKGKATTAVARTDKPKEEYSSGVQEAERNKLAFFEGCSFNFDLEDLLRASAEVLGKGSYGTTYKAVLEDGTNVVVKRLKEVVVGKRDFEQQMDVIGRVGRHKNVMPLRAYYYSKDEKLLVFDYMPSGSLSAALHRNKAAGRASLGWDARVKIALGTAQGLVHLQSGSSGKFVHGNIKSSNILLTPDHDAFISEFGLAQLISIPQSALSKLVGYRAPEVVETRKPTQKSDVYSFGVLLLELLTGKAPLRSPGREDSGSVDHLPRWVQSVVREEWTGEVFDIDLLQCPKVEEEMVQMLQLAMACVTTQPDQRPRMDDVVRRIEEIRAAGADARQ